MLPAIKRMLAFDEAGMELVGYNADQDDSFFGKMHKLQHETLKPGSQGLDEITRRTRENLFTFLNELTELTDISIYAWCRRVFTLSNTAAAFGENDPFGRYDDAEQMFWWVPSNTHWF